MLVAQRWILARLRNRTCFSVEELNVAVAELLEQLNDRPMKRYGGQSRRQLFERLDRPALQTLPPEPFVFAEWKTGKVNIDYHVEVDHHYYSVPHALVHERVEARISATTVEIFLRGQRVASHARSFAAWKHTTVREHMPKSHQQHLEWTPSRLCHWGSTVGPHTEALVRAILESRPHPEQGYRACLGILRLARQYRAERLEAACDRGLDIGARSYGSIQSILKHGLDRRPPKPARQGELLPTHPNIRGSRYSH